MECVSCDIKFFLSFFLSSSTKEINKYFRGPRPHPSCWCPDGSVAKDGWGAASGLKTGNVSGISETRLHAHLRFEPLTNLEHLGEMFSEKVIE